MDTQNDTELQIAFNKDGSGYTVYSDDFHQSYSNKSLLFQYINKYLNKDNKKVDAVKIFKFDPKIHQHDPIKHVNYKPHLNISTEYEYKTKYKCKFYEEIDDENSHKCIN